MLLIKNRLKSDRDFKKVLKFGTFFGTKNLRAKLLKIKEGNESIRFGFIIGLKVSKKAVVRNRLKRQVREVIRLLLKENKIKNGFDVTINLGIGLSELNYQEIEKEVELLLKRGGLM